MSAEQRIAQAIEAVGHSVTAVGRALGRTGCASAEVEQEPITESVSKAIDVAASTTRQLITLSTGVLALSLTFVDELLPQKIGPTPKVWITIGWVVLFVSTLLGVGTLGALAGVCNKASKDTPASIYAQNIRMPASAQAATFLIGLSILGITLWTQWI